VTRDTTATGTGRLPTFVVIGAHKAGTTSLFHYLASHPDVYMPPEKELHFFTEHNWDRGLDWYRSKFDGAGSVRAVGEASPGYTCWPRFDRVPERMVEVLPEARLVYIVRHPVERLVAHYRHDSFHWGNQGPIEEALLDYRQYLSRSMYALQIERFLAYFPRRQLLVVVSEELQASRETVISKVHQFIGVDHRTGPRLDARDYNRADEQRRDRPGMSRLRGSRLHTLTRRVTPASFRRTLWRGFGSARIDPELAHISIDDTLRRRIVDELRPDLERLREHLGHEFHCWGLLDDPLSRPAVPLGRR
jgi:hypothetical protein